MEIAQEGITVASQKKMNWFCVLQIRRHLESWEFSLGFQDMKGYNKEKSSCSLSAGGETENN